MPQFKAIFFFLSLLIFSLSMFPAFASLENSLQAIPAQPKILSCLDTRPISWQLLLEHKDLKPLIQNEELKNQLQSWQNEIGIDLINDVLPALGSHVCLAYYLPPGKTIDWGTGASERGKLSSIKANMYSLQTLLESYAYDLKGIYPQDLNQLYKKATDQQYWTELINPYTYQIGIGPQAALLDYQQLEPGKHLAGQVAYIPLMDPKSKQINSYIIVGFDKNGELIQQFNRESQSSKLYYLSAPENTADLFGSGQSIYASQFNGIIAKLQLYPTARLKAKRPDSLLLSVDLQSEVSAKQLFIKTLNHLQDLYIRSIEEFDYRDVRGLEIIFDTEIKPLTFFQNPSSEQQSQSMYIGITGKKLLISLAGDSTIWKQAVDAALEPASNTGKQSILEPILNDLKSDKFWVYADHDLITGFVNETFHRFDQPSAEALANFQKDLFIGTALGLDWQVDGFDIHHHHLYAPDLNLEQAQQLADLKQEKPLTGLLQYSPEKPLVFTELADLKQIFQEPQVFEFSTLALTQALQPLRSKTFPEEFQLLTNLNLEQELLNELKGPAALLLLDTGRNSISPLPGSLILQAHDAPGLLKKLLHQFALNPSVLADRGWLPPLDYLLIANLNQLQDAIEAFGDQQIQSGVERQAIYPAHVQAIQAGEYRADVDMSYVGSYSLEFTNPVTGSKDLAANLADFKAFQDDRQREKFKGMILYQPIGKPVYDSSPKQSFYPSYRLWGYTHDGYLLELSKNGDLKTPKRLSERPFKWNPVATEKYHGIPLYQWQNTEMLRHFEKQTGIEPVMAQMDDKLLLSTSLDALKQSIDSLQQVRPSITQSPDFQTALQKLNPQPGSEFFYSDTKSWAELLQRSWAKQYPHPSEFESLSLSKMQKLFSAFSSISRSARYESEAYTSHLRIAANIEQLDFKILGELAFGSGIDSGEGYRRARISSVKANMHTLQTILETYAIETDGIYPEDLERLYEAAEIGLYWKDFNNPQTSALGIGMRGSVMDYKDYQPSSEFAGMVLYEVTQRNQNGKAVEYKIYGCDDQGNLITSKTGVFYLSNH